MLNGGKVKLPEYPTLLVTSCVSNGQAKLFFLDPQTDPATLVTMPTGQSNPLNISITPTSLVFRPDQGDLLACVVTNTTTLKAIDISPFNNVVDGTVTDVSKGPSGGACRGIAWEQRRVVSNGVVSLVPTIYQTSTAGPATGSTVLRYTPHLGGGQVQTTPLAVGCPNNGNAIGIGVVGQSLFVGCQPASGSGPSTIRQVDKSNPATLVRSFSHSSTLPVGLGDDPVTLGAGFKELLWSKDQNASQLKAIEIPGGTLGQFLGAPVAFPAACPPTYPTQNDGGGLDGDGDALLDCWEDGTLWSDGLPGISFAGNWTTLPRNSSERDLTLCVGVQCASPIVRDIFLEIDWMTDLTAGHTHDPRVSAPNAVTNVIAAFAAAPTPIQLLVEFSEGLPHTTSTALTPCTAPPATGDASFDVLKANHFGALAERNDPAKTGTLNARAFVYHYLAIVHNQSGSSSSGCAEVKGNDLMVSLGSWGAFNFGSVTSPIWHSVGTPDQQEGTIMHELGHNLGLLHGGDDHINCKPNYPSVMSYGRQFSQPGFMRPLDFSRQELLPLSEAGLNEADGIGNFTGQIIFGPPVVVQSGQPAKPTVATVLGGAIDWNRSGNAGDSGFQQDLTSMAGLGCPAILPQTLLSFDDWSNLHFNFRASVDFASGASASHVEDKSFGNKDIELDEALAISLDVIDIKPADPHNLISTKNSQSISVAIFSRAGDVGGAGALDATATNPGTLTLRGVYPFTWVLPVKQSNQGSYQCKTQDVSNDGLLDLVCQFEIPKGTISINETQAVIDGLTFNDEPVHASQFITPH